MSKLLIKNAAELVTCSGNEGLNIINNGAVLIEDGIITKVGKTKEILAGRKENLNLEETEISNSNKNQKLKVIDAEGQAVMPGFVDPHTHFIFGGYRADEFNWRLQGVPYTEIMDRGGGIVNSVSATRKASFSELKKRGRMRLDSMLSYGVTTVEGKTGYGLDIETELKQLKVMKELEEEHPLTIIKTFLGAHAFPSEYKEDKEGYVDYVINDMIPAIQNEGGADFIDVFCDQGVFSVEQARSILKAGQKSGLKAKIHADEIAAVGAAEMAAEIEAVSADHLLKASDKGIEMMAEAGVMAVLLPITAFSLKEEYAPARKMIEKGLNIAVATDFNPGSCYSESIPLLIVLSTLYMGLSPEEAVRGLTINAAAAINREDKIGSIEEGKQGDIVILSAPSYLHLSYHMGVNSVSKVIKKGVIVSENGY